MSYLDHNATTPARPEVIRAVSSAMAETGNASSVHLKGRHARGVVETARQQVAALVTGCDPKGVLFTSGATEANNTVLKSFTGRIITSAIEHPSVMECGSVMEGGMVGRIPVKPDGIVDMKALAAMLDGAALVSVMMVNNETGVIQPIAEIAALAKAKGVRVHCDGVQAAGRIPMDMTNIDYLTLSAHKMGGPMGVGAVVVGAKAPPVKLIHGGGQERRQRAGTENIPGIAGFGVAAQHADRTAFQKLSILRDRIEKEIAGITLFGADAPRVANTTCFALPGVTADTQLMALDLAGFQVSSGSACSSGSVKPSHVLEAMHVAPSLAACALRISLGWNTQATDIDRFIATYQRLAASWKKDS